MKRKRKKARSQVKVQLVSSIFSEGGKIDNEKLDTIIDQSLNDAVSKYEPLEIFEKGAKALEKMITNKEVFAQTEDQKTVITVDGVDFFVTSGMSQSDANFIAKNMDLIMEIVLYQAFNKYFNVQSVPLISNEEEKDAFDKSFKENDSRYNRAINDEKSVYKIIADNKDMIKSLLPYVLVTISEQFNEYKHKGIFRKIFTSSMGKKLYKEMKNNGIIKNMQIVEQIENNAKKDKEQEVDSEQLLLNFFLYLIGLYIHENPQYDILDDELIDSCIIAEMLDQHTYENEFEKEKTAISKAENPHIAESNKVLKEVQSSFRSLFKKINKRFKIPAIEWEKVEGKFVVKSLSAVVWQYIKILGPTALAGYGLLTGIRAYKENGEGGFKGFGKSAKKVLRRDYENTADGIKKGYHSTRDGVTKGYHSVRGRTHDLAEAIRNKYHNRFGKKLVNEEKAQESEKITAREALKEGLDNVSNIISDKVNRIDADKVQEQVKEAFEI